MRLYFIRHAQSTNNARQPGAPRIPDADLSDLGREQAQQTATYLATMPDPLIEMEGYSITANSHGVMRLITSPAWRSLATAKPIGDTLQCPVEVWHDLHEMGGTYEQQGDQFIGLPGRTRSEIAQAFPTFAIPETITDAGWWNQDYETWDASLVRARAVVQRLQSMMPSTDIVVIVTHQVFFNLILKLFMDMKPFEKVYMINFNCSISCLDVAENGTLFVRYLNRTRHLPDHMLTT